MAKGFQMIWRSKEVIKAVKTNLRKSSKEIAESVMKDAVRRLREKADTKSERGLLTQFDMVASSLNDESFLVWCQGPRNWLPPYHASFVELGTVKTKAKPYLNPARKAHKSIAKQKFKEALK